MSSSARLCNKLADRLVLPTQTSSSLALSSVAFNLKVNVSFDTGLATNNSVTGSERNDKTSAK